MAVAAKIGAWSDRKSKRNDRRVQILASKLGEEVGLPKDGFVSNMMCLTLFLKHCTEECLFASINAATL